MLTVPNGAQTHLPLLLLPQSLSGCSFFTTAFTPQSSPLQFALKNYKDKVDISNMATTLIASVADVSPRHPKDKDAEEMPFLD